MELLEDNITRNKQYVAPAQSFTNVSRQSHSHSSRDPWEGLGALSHTNGLTLLLLSS